MEGENMIKRIESNNKVFNSEEFQKDKYKFFLILQNLSSNNLELYSDEKNYVLCRGGVNWPTWIWTQDNLNKKLLPEIEEAIDLYRLDIDTRFTCKKELYNLLKKDYKNLGDYYFEMGYLVCNKTIKPKETDGCCKLVSENDKEILTKFIYNESREISDVKELSFEAAQSDFDKRLAQGNYYVWKNKNNKIVAQAFYKVIDGNAKISGVYTLPEERGNAYAANLIYELTNKALKEGNHVSLYTDYNYIPSNKAYKNVGYKDSDILINFSCSKKITKVL
jgi:GNAT superfamily N-acetyltransferase